MTRPRDDDPRVQRDPLWDVLADANREIATAYALLHGLRATYRKGCRCLPCRAANASYRPARRVPAYLVRQRIRALEAGGYTLIEIARRARLHRSSLRSHHQTVRQETAQRIEALYRWARGE